MLHRITIAVIDAVLVHLTGFCLRNIAFPEISVRYFIHFPFLPFIKFSDQGDTGSRRGERTECYALFFCMCTKIFISIKYFSCVKSIKIHFILLTIIDISCFFEYTMIIVSKGPLPPVLAQVWENDLGTRPI